MQQFLVRTLQLAIFRPALGGRLTNTHSTLLVRNFSPGRPPVVEVGLVAVASRPLRRGEKRGIAMAIIATMICR